MSSPLRGAGDVADKVEKAGASLDDAGSDSSDGALDGVDVSDGDPDVGSDGDDDSGADGESDALSASEDLLEGEEGAGPGVGAGGSLGGPGAVAPQEVDAGEVRYIGAVFLEKLAGEQVASEQSFSCTVVWQLAGVVRQAADDLRDFGGVNPEVVEVEAPGGSQDKLVLTMQAAVRALSQYMQRRVRSVRCELWAVCCVLVGCLRLLPGTVKPRVALGLPAAPYRGCQRRVWPQSALHWWTLVSCKTWS